MEVTKKRFERAGLELPEVAYHPVEPEAARKLAPDGKAFERWALLKVRAARLRKYDRGIDGEAYFREADGTMHHVVVSVKGVKHPNPAMVRELRGTLTREKADVGVLVLAAEPSKEMLREASRAEHLAVSDSEGPIPRLQIVTLERLFSDLPAIRCPGVNVTEMPRPAVPQRSAEQLTLDLEASAGASGARHANMGGPVKAKRGNARELVKAKAPANDVGRTSETPPPAPKRQRRAARG